MRLTVADRITIASPPTKVLAFLSDIAHLARYEPKVRSVGVFPSTSREGRYSAKGWFGLIPWKGDFSYHIGKNGFRSETLGPIRGVTVRGGFSVKADGKSCRLTHDESYEIPFWIAPWAPVIRAYLRWALRRELTNIQKAVVNPA